MKEQKPIECKKLRGLDYNPDAAVPAQRNYRLYLLDVTTDLMIELIRVQYAPGRTR
jgi:hypothetical protein|uniref:Uncharacterized protein n=1 Tax=Picea glauca TaxID=3330 RepID=A0A117NGB4_PICGL|nr:hypothetical protein ABT39_MTgene1563 [Picea glauca]QHR88348.1 hypothetical protein Q903MT_gene2361 [Picea sitchensis]